MFINELAITSAILVDGAIEPPRLKITFDDGQQCAITDNPNETWRSLYPALEKINAAHQKQIECLS